MTDSELISFYLKGDLRAFERFYDRHKDSLYTYLINRKPQQAEDYFQETFLRFLNVVGTRKIEQPAAYLFRIAVNLVRDDMRRTEPRIISLSYDMPEEKEAEPEPFDEQQLQLSLVRLSQDKPAFYDVLHLHVYERMTFDEISAITGENRNTVASRYRYALKYLRDVLKIIPARVKIGENHV
ncbi:MAG: sigma-70 family RNA polymerase sigma factor [Candidatus Cloacimonetes bacterium]|nr:sigma-70 family RNA polymerase sigma factor [Candidatus Cloacimonadota bacterium]